MKSRTGLAFGLAIGVHVAVSVFWYGTRPHYTPVAGYLALVSVVFGGFLMGLLARPRRLLKAALLGMLLSIISGFINWAAGQLGQPVDFGTPAGSVLLLMITMPMCVLLSLLGGLGGMLVNRFMAKRPIT